MDLNTGPGSQRIILWWECCTWVEWILDAEQRLPVALGHLLLGVLLREVAAAVRHADARLEVVEAVPVQLKELDQEHPKILWLRGSMNLLEKNDEPFLFN